MIFYFSATGNSKHVAKRIADALNDKVASIEEKIADINLSNGECFGIVTPTNWFELPILVRQFIIDVNINQSSNNYFFIVATYGSSCGFVGEDAKRELKNKNINLDAMYSVLMPDNWTPIFDLSNKEAVDKINSNAEGIIDNIINMIKEKRKGNFQDKKAPYIMKPICDFLLEMERRTKNFYVENTCIGCKLCEKNCPVKAIEVIDGKPRWIKEKCALCFRCLHNCPKFAIQYGNGKTKIHGQYKHK